MDGVKANEEGFYPSPVGKIKGPLLSGDASFDINCRCTTRAEIEGYAPKVRIARENEGKRGEIIKMTTYNKWKEARIKS